MESGEKEREKAVRDERNEQRAYHSEEECELCDEREEVSHTAQAHVSIIVRKHFFITKPLIFYQGTSFNDELLYRFLVNMHYAFQDRENLYLIIDIMQGGDLRYHFAKHRKFTEE